MNTNKAAYWIALGVLALGLNSEYNRGNFPELQCIADRTGYLLSQISIRAEQTLAVAKVLVLRDRFQAETLLASKNSADNALEQARDAQQQARKQAEMIHDQVRERMLAQADAIRAESEMRRAEIEQVRARANFGLVRAMNGRFTVVCPKTRTRILVNDASDSADSSSEIEVED